MPTLVTLVPTALLARSRSPAFVVGGALVMGVLAVLLILTVWVAGLALWPGAAAVFLGSRAHRLGAPIFLVRVSILLGLLGVGTFVALLLE
jgi:hypothetical protein